MATQRSDDAVIGATLELIRAGKRDELVLDEPGAGAAPAAPSTSLRAAALQAAATFAAGVVLGSSQPLTSADVLRVAEAFERWLLGRER
jgi:hypothetical protein